MANLLLGDSKGPLEALREYYGERSFLRRTQGTQALSQAISRLRAIERDCEALAAQQKNDALKAPQFGKLASDLADLVAGQAGWDTDKSIKAIEAATSMRQNPLVKADADADL